MNVSIIICTYNRSNILKECIESLLNNNKCYQDYEVIVVDNNSKDNTKEVVEDIRKHFKNVFYFFEGKQGLSAARNRGIKEAKKEILAFIDDDVIVEENYISSILKYFKENKDIICAGGKISTLWPCEKPVWFSDRFYSIIGETKYGNTFRELKGNECPYGGNMFFRKHIFHEIGNFSEDLGLKGDEVILGEEVEVCDRIKEKGNKLYYIPEAKVKHRVHLNKVNKEYINKRWKMEGKAAGICISNLGKMPVLVNIIKRIGILTLRDYPKYIILGVIDKNNRFYYDCQKNRSLAVLKNLKFKSE